MPPAGEDLLLNLPSQGRHSAAEDRSRSPFGVQQVPQGFENAKIKIYGIFLSPPRSISQAIIELQCLPPFPGNEHGKIHKRTRRECLSCHHQTKSKCTDCHESQMQFIRGETLREKEPQPDVMAREVKCIECHTTISDGHSRRRLKRPAFNVMTPSTER